MDPCFTGAFNLPTRYTLATLPTVAKPSSGHFYTPA